MNEQNDFERQVEQEERAQTDPESVGKDASFDTSEVVDKIKELVKKGNVTKIVVKRGENEIVSIPLNAGIVGGLLGIAAAPWAVVAAAVAAAGFSCRVELVKDDGEVVQVTGKAIGEKAKDLGNVVADVGGAVFDSLKGAVESIKDQASDIEVEIHEEDPQDPKDL